MVMPKVKFYDIVVEVDIDGVDYPVELKDREYVYDIESYDSPEMFEDNLDEAIDQLSDDLGWAILSVNYDNLE